MTRNNTSKQSATDATNVIPFPGKLARHQRAAAKKAGFRNHNLVLRQALFRRRGRPASCRVHRGGIPATISQGYRIGRMAA